MTVSSLFSFCTHRMGLFIYFPSFFHESCFLISLKCIWVLWVPYYFFSFIKFDSFYGTFLSPLHFTITKTLKKPHSTTDSHHSSRQKHQEWKEGQWSGRWWRVTLHVHTCSGHNRNIPLMWRPNTDSAPNKPVHTVTIRYKCEPTLRLHILRTGSFPGIKRPGLQADRLPRSSAEIMNEWQLYPYSVYTPSMTFK